MKITTVEEAKALVGQTFGSGKNARTVVQISDLGINDFDGHTIVGHVYWKRPGGKERSISHWLPYFVQWINKTTRESAQTCVNNIDEVKGFLDKLKWTDVTGFVSQDGNEVTVSITSKGC